MKDYLVLTEDVLIVRRRPHVYDCVGCEFQLFPIPLTSPRELLDHVELHRHSGHAIPKDALERVKKELE